MDKKRAISNKTKLCFCRWSRKNFAMFCSLGRHVVISKLKNSIADASLSKKKFSKNNFIILSQCESLINKYTGLVDEYFYEIISEILISKEEAVSVEAAQSLFYINNIISCKHT